jgi:hypothetical protein
VIVVGVEPPDPEPDPEPEPDPDEPVEPEEPDVPLDLEVPVEPLEPVADAPAAAEDPLQAVTEARRRAPSTNAPALKVTLTALRDIRLYLYLTAIEGARNSGPETRRRQSGRR